MHVLMYVDMRVGTHGGQKWVGGHWDLELQPFVGAQFAMLDAVICILVVMVVWQTLLTINPSL